MARGLARYGVAKSPFTVERVIPFTGVPMQPLPKVIEVDGFGKIQQIDDHIAAAADSTTPGQFLIVGKRGSGTSFLAKYILERYRELRGIDRSRFVVPNPKINHDPVSVVWQWLGLIYPAARKIKGLDLEAVNKELVDALKTKPAEISTPFNALVTEPLSEVFAAADPPAGFAFCLERVPAYTLIQAGLDAFASGRTLCVYTVLRNSDSEEELVAKAKAVPGELNVFELSELVGTDVYKLIDGYWKTQSQEESPFHPTVVERAIGNKPRTIAQVLMLVDKVLQTKADLLNEGEVWPNAAAELAITEDNIDRLRNRFKDIDKYD